jgi:hypothetical protein
MTLEQYTLDDQTCGHKKKVVVDLIQQSTAMKINFMPRKKMPSTTKTSKMKISILPELAPAKG